MNTLLWEILTIGIFVFIASYGLHYITFKKGFDDEEGHDDHDDELEEDPQRTDVKAIVSNGFIKKWLDFGGGYYGVVAFVKLVLIELDQLKDLLTDWPGAEQFVSGLGINTIVAFFIQQMQSFVTAIIWPTNYLRAFSIFECALFVAATYALYAWSRSIAKKHNQDRPN